MRNFDDALNRVVQAVRESETEKGEVFVATGPVGIGKSYFLDAIEATCATSSLIVRFNGVDAPAPPLEPIYAGLFDAVTVGQRLTAFGKELLDKYVKLIPGFGQYLEPVLSGLSHASASEALRRRGLALSTSPATHIARMLADASRGKPVVVLCDDIQWLDDESWLCVVRLAENAGKNRLVIAMTCSSDSSPRTPRLEQLVRYRASPPHSNWAFIDPEPWPVAGMSELCDRLVCRHCRFSNEELARLHAASDGLPLYVDSILRTLIADGRVVVPDDNGDVTSMGPWPELDIESSLKSYLIARLKAAYSSIAQSRDTLEAASVLGDPFSDAPLGEITDVDGPFQVLSEIERDASLVSYYLERRHWRFNHSQIRKVIYDSLGADAMKLHRRLADVFRSQRDVDPSVVAHHLERSGNLVEAFRYRAKQVKDLLHRGVFLSARLVAEQALEVADSFASRIDSTEFLRLRLNRAKALYGEFRFRDALTEFMRLVDAVRHPDDRADALRWLGRCHVKLDSQRDFDAACKYLDEARKMYGKLGDSAGEADTLSDIVAAEAHRNRYREARRAFVAAETLYNQLSDRIGMARLQRRNLILVDPALALPIQQALSDSFRDFGMLHEQIMAMNNAASLLLYDNRIKDAMRSLEEALDLSIDLSDFGADYIYNNLAIVHTIQRNFAGAREAIERARSYNARAVMSLIVDSTESVLIAAESGPARSLPFLEAVARRADQVGEYSYTQPAYLNLAIALSQLERYPDALAALKLIPPRRECTFPRYKHARWYEACIRILRALGDDEAIAEMERDHAWARSPREGPYDAFEYAFTSTQFWSD